MKVLPVTKEAVITLKGVIMMALAMLNIGDKAVIKELHTKDSVKKHLQNLGFVTGEEIEVIGENSSGLILSVKGVRVALNRGLATQIYVA